MAAIGPVGGGAHGLRDPQGPQSAFLGSPCHVFSLIGLIFFSPLVCIFAKRFLFKNFELIPSVEKSEKNMQTKQKSKYTHLHNRKTGAGDIH